MNLVKAQTILGVIGVAGFVVITALAFLAAKFGVDWAKNVAENILPLLVGCWITNFTTIVNYYFGSSQQQQTHSEAVSEALTRALKPEEPLNLTNEVKK